MSNTTAALRLADGATEWDGVRAPAARLHLRAMKTGDEAFFYHSMDERSVIAIMRGDIDVTCLDAVAKKAAFVQQVAAELGLPNLRGLHARVESLTGSFDQGRGTFVRAEVYGEFDVQTAAELARLSPGERAAASRFRRELSTSTSVSSCDSRIGVSLFMRNILSP